MRAYKRMAKFSILIAIISLLIAIFLNFCFVIDKTGFWTNVCLGVFGSATLSFRQMFGQQSGHQSKRLKTGVCIQIVFQAHVRADGYSIVLKSLRSFFPTYQYFLYKANHLLSIFLPVFDILVC